MPHVEPLRRAVGFAAMDAGAALLRHRTQPGWLWQAFIRVGAPGRRSVPGQPARPRTVWLGQAPVLAAALLP